MTVPRLAFRIGGFLLAAISVWALVAKLRSSDPLPEVTRGVRARSLCSDRMSADNYFPADRFDPVRIAADLELRQYYSGFLRAMGEPSLYCGEGGTSSYRLTRLTYTGVPVSVRLTKDDATVTVFAVKLEAPTWSLPPGAIVAQHKHVEGEVNWTTLLAAVDRAGFWGLRTDEGQKTQDGPGTAWILEGRRGPLYHVVNRSSPGAGPFKDVGLMLLRLANIVEAELEGDAPGVRLKTLQQSGLPPPPPAR